MSDVTKSAECNHVHEVECGFLGMSGPVKFRLCSPCAASVWAAMAELHRESYWIKPLVIEEIHRGEV